MDQDPAVNVNEEGQGKAREDNPVIKPCSNDSQLRIKHCLGVLPSPLDFWVLGSEVAAQGDPWDPWMEQPLLGFSWGGICRMEPRDSPGFSSWAVPCGRRSLAGVGIQAAKPQGGCRTGAGSAGGSQSTA